MFGFEFANPKYFLLLVLLVPMILWYVFKENNRMRIYSFLLCVLSGESGMPEGYGCVICFLPVKCWRSYF